MKIIDMRKRLNELKQEVEERDPKGWDDYEWCTRDCSFTEGQISLLEELLGINCTKDAGGKD